MDAETFGLFRSAIRRFVDERLISAEDAVEEADAVPESIVDEMREMGLFGISVPEEYGGLGCTMSEEAALIRELTRASVVFRSVIGTTLGMLIADVPAVFVGDRLASRIPMKLVHSVAAAIFALLGSATLLGAGSGLGF